jgi:lysophospholipase L1-like esterase
MTAFPVPSGAKFLFIGDSITDCDRAAWAAPLGSGYVRRFTELVTFHHPELDIEWLNHGIGGDVIGDLRRRWEADAVAHEPQWLAIMIGINDCHGNIEGEEAWAEQTYEEDFRDLLDRVQPFAPKLVLLDPFYAATADGRWPVDDFQRQILGRLGAYHRVVANLAREYDAIHVRTQDMFTRQLRYRWPTFFGPEPVHPELVGHTMIALELYRTLVGPTDSTPRKKSAPSRRERRQRRQQRGRRR